MEKKIRILLIIILTISVSLFIQVVVSDFELSFIIIFFIILIYYYILIRLKSFTKNAIIFVEKIYDKIRGIDVINTESLNSLGIQTNQGYIYEGTRMRHIKPFFSENSGLFSFSEKIIDLGSGKGSALIAFKELGFKNVAGVEISERLCSITKDNLQKLKIADVEIFNCDILNFDQYTDFDIFYLFNPFPAEVLKIVVSEIEKSLEVKPRKVKIIYMNPKHHDEIDSSRFFRRAGEFNYDSEKSSFRKIFLYQN